ncbi:hypothetical protein FEM48_Zijuj11G0151000 [Ziziphus jujuba var. spinosa]|uniref:Uncharacterized protein n=1 Tax=Ziziphus jujuba var. spinosa TaxID=714518 RepID=A0A978UJN0_ZIZJJ|nr:hypothetical protein FEM48_Zijuj11G0151000 [Ziziphus jujuba var. spinosa]
MSVTTLTNSLAHYRSPSSPHRRAPHNLSPTGPKTRANHPPPTRPSPNSHSLILSTRSSGPQNPRPRFGNPPAADLSLVPVLWLFRRLLFPKRSLLAPSMQNLHHRVAEFERGQLIPAHQGRGGEQDVGFDPESVWVEAELEQGDFFLEWKRINSVTGMKKRLEKELE